MEQQDIDDDAMLREMQADIRLVQVDLGQDNAPAGDSGKAACAPPSRPVRPAADGGRTDAGAGQEFSGHTYGKDRGAYEDGCTGGGGGGS